MTVIITPNGFRKSYDGALRLAVDGTGTIWTFPNSRVVYDVDLGYDYPLVMDSQQVIDNRVAGLVTGQISARGILHLGRGFEGFLNAGFGPRTAGKLIAMIGTIIPYGGAAAEVLTGIWWDTLTITGEFNARGQVMMLAYEASGRIMDPLNVLGATALAAGTNEGVPGIGLSTLASSKVTNGAATSPTTYDGVRRFTLVFMNSLTMDPSNYPGHEADRICAGYTPGPFMGKLGLTQLKGALQALPAAGAPLPLTLKIPSGDGSKMLTLDTSNSADGRQESLSPEDYDANAYRYTLFSSNGTNGTGAANGGAGYSFAAAVA